MSLITNSWKWGKICLGIHIWALTMTLSYGCIIMLLYIIYIYYIVYIVILFSISSLFHQQIFLFIPEPAKSLRRLFSRVSASSSSTQRRPNKESLSRPLTYKLAWRTTILKRTSVSLALLSTFYPKCWGSQPIWRTLTQGLKNWVDEAYFIDID